MGISKREEVLDELAIFLRDRNKKKNSLSTFLRHPFMLMLVGTVAVAIITNIWASKERQSQLEIQWQRTIIEKQLDLYENLQTHYHQTGSYANSWFVMLVGYAKELLKPKNPKRTTRLDFYKKRGMEAEKLFMSSMPLDNQLGQVKVLFKSQKVLKSAEKMDHKWSEFIKKLNSCSRKLNTVSYTKDDITEWNSFRINTIDELEKLKVDLTNQMSNEIAFKITDQ